MQAVAMIALGVGAFITTSVAATLIMRRRGKRTSSDDEWVHVDLAERGLGDGLDVDPEVYHVKRGEGWKEYGGEQMMVDTGMLAPLVLHDQMTVPATPSPTRTPLFPERHFSTPPRWQLSPMPTVPVDDPHIPQPERSPTPTAPLLEGPEDVSEHVNQAPGTNITSVVETEVPLAAEAGAPLANDALPTGIISWPAMSAPVEDDTVLVSPTPAEDALCEPVNTEPVLQLELAPAPPTLPPLSLSVQTLDLGADIKSPIIQDEEFDIPVLDLKSPVTDSTNPFRDLASHSPLEDDLLPPPPVYTRYDTAKSPTDPNLVETLLSPLAQPTVNIFITSHMDDQDSCGDPGFSPSKNAVKGL